MKNNSLQICEFVDILLVLTFWNNLGHVLAGGNGDVGDIEGKPELEQAYELGKSIQQNCGKGRYRRSGPPQAENPASRILFVLENRIWRLGVGKFRVIW